MPPLALLGGLALWPEFLHGVRSLYRWPPVLMLLGVLMAYGLSLLWSTDLRLGVRSIVYLWVFLAIFSAVVLQLEKDERVAWQLLSLTVLFAAIEAGVVIAFRISPELEATFLDSNFAQLFINPNTLEALYTTGRNNVLDPEKSGGFFTNGNVAGAYLWIMAMASSMLAVCKRKRSMYVLSSFFIVAAYFSGSKAVVLLFPVLATIVLITIAWHLSSRPPFLIKGFLMVGIVIVLGLIGPQLITHNTAEQTEQTEQEDFLQQSESTLGIRLLVWRYGAEAFLEKPFLGQGFGGWQQGYSSYAESVGIKDSFPPHNTLIYLWSQGGILALLFGFAFMLFVTISGLQQILKGQPQSSGIAVIMLGAFAWTFIHGMGTNFGLVGDIHMIPILATLLAFSCSMSNKNLVRKIA
ncbi:hypothetical protein GCM10027172_18660 [Halomonas garicola]